MKKKTSGLLWLWLLLFSVHGLAQNVAIPDSNFRKFLIKTYPATIDASGNLILSEAKKVGGVINGSNQNIQSIEGIQYFTGASTISFVTNNLSTIPDISNLTNLGAINLMYNQLVYLPPLATLKRLKSISVHDNSLRKLPDLSQNDSLIEINVNTNLLDSMPNLSPLVQLQRLYVHNNQIKAHFGEEKLISLVEYWCNGNLLGNFPDLSNLKKLLYFDASGNQLTTAPFLGKNSPIQTLLLTQNAISFLPDYTTYASLKTVKLQNNNLTFKELTKIVPIAGYATIFQINPQNILRISSPMRLLEGNPTTFSTHIDTLVSNVSYDWYQSTLLDTSVLGDKWTIPYVHFQDSGRYFTRLRHPAFPNFYLQTDTFPVSVVPCLDLSTFSTATTEINCLKTGTLEVSPATPINSLQYQLKSPESGKVYTSQNGKFFGLSEPAYILSVQTSTGCSKTSSKQVKIPTQKCKDYLITPDNDGNADTFYFEATGKVEIYDKRGNMIRRLSIPSEWDCFTDKGKVASGYYIANINDGESQIGLTVAY
jgi:hypothetical protein